MKRIKYIAQIQQTECGLCVIAMMLNYYGAHYSLYDLRRFVEIGRDGMSVADILHMFEKFGLHVDAFKCQDVQKLRNLNAPFIITMEKNHMVIVEKVTKHNIYIVDSAFGKLKYSYEEFVRSFDGICIEVVPGEKFCKKKREHKMFKILFPLMKEKKWKYVLFMCFSFFNYFLLMLLLTYMQKFVDSIYENGNSLIYIYYILLLIIMYIISTLFMKFYMGDLKIVIDKKINLKLINHLLNLPYIFFDTRKKTDILFTLNHVSYVKEILVSDILNVFLNIGILCVIWVYFFFMNYSMMIALSIVFWGNVFLAFLSQKILTNNMRKLVVENSKVQGYQTEMLYAMFSIKSGCIEGKIFEDWKKKYLTYNRRYGSNERISAIWNTVLTISQILSPLIVLGVWVLVEQRNIVSMGKFVEIFSLTEIFFSQVYGLFNSLMNINMNSVYIERLGDIFFNGVRGNEKKGIKEIHNINSIKIENLCFKYTETSQHILNNISLEINEGECVAIVGRSGSGKSTLLKVISGLYEFSVGKILINGEMSNEIDKKSLVKQIGIVPQEAYLFNKSIYDNLTENQDNISKEQIDKVLRAVGIYDEIVNMPMGVNTLVSEMGTNLSGGQRQRLIIARELLKNPSFLILDEATSTLDYVNEKKILKYISESKITCLLVTHRISSIKNADYILFMENGTIVEEGKHDELIKMRGRYFDMYECKK